MVWHSIDKVAVNAIVRFPLSVISRVFFVVDQDTVVATVLALMVRRYLKGSITVNTLKHAGNGGRAVKEHACRLNIIFVSDLLARRSIFFWKLVVQTGCLKHKIRNFW